MREQVLPRGAAGLPPLVGFIARLLAVSVAFHMNVAFGLAATGQHRKLVIDT